MKSHSFAAQLSYSKNIPARRVQDALKRHIHDHHRFEKTSKEDDLKGIDAFSLDRNGKKLGIDFKRRRQSYQGDVLLEYSSGRGLGWALKDNETDAYLVTHDDGSDICIPASPLRRILNRKLSEWKKSFRIVTTLTGKSYRSSCVAVPFGILKQELAKDRLKHPQDHKRFRL